MLPFWKQHLNAKKIQAERLLFTLTQTMKFMASMENITRDQTQILQYLLRR